MPKIEISNDAFEYLQKFAMPLIDTTVTAMDRLVREHKEKLRPAGEAVNPGVEMSFRIGAIPSMKFTLVDSASIDGNLCRKNYWNDILEDVIGACAAKGAKNQEILTRMNANSITGRKIGDGFRFVESADLSFQGLDADRACKNILLLASKFKIDVSVSFHWSENPKSLFPSQSGKLIHP